MALAPSPALCLDSSGDERPRWDNKFQYLLSCIGLAVGLGNVWRFPYLCQTYGGGAFLIPYVVALLLGGFPLLHVELAIGQRLRRGSVGVWTAISPYLGGVGLGCLSVSFLVGLYYNTVLLWVLWYLLNSFQYPLPWSACPPDRNGTGLEAECQGSGAVSYFWYRVTLNISADIRDSGAVQWRLLACLAACWMIVYLCISRGIESTGKAIYFTALFPYLVLTIFLVRGLTLPGATEGLLYLFTPNMRVLKSPRVWLDAATQIFLSLSLGFGGHVAFASYNPPRNNCEKDAVTIALINSMTSLYASIAVFSILGFKATSDFGQCLDRNILSLTNAFELPDQSVSRDDYLAVLTHLNASQPARVARLPLATCHLQDFLDKGASGTGLAFMAFTEAVLRLPGSPAWAALFFTMLLCLGLSSMFGNMQAMVTPLLDMRLVARSLPKEALTGLVCLVCFLVSSCFTLQSGNYWLEVFDSYAALSLLALALCEVVGVAFVYGLRRFCDDVAWMNGRRPGLYWRAAWKVGSPLLLLTVLGAYLGQLAQKPPSYRTWNPHYTQFPARQEKPYPGWVQAACVLLAILPTLWIPAVALARLFARQKRRWQDTPPALCLTCPPPSPDLVGGLQVEGGASLGEVLPPDPGPARPGAPGAPRGTPCRIPAEGWPLMALVLGRGLLSPLPGAAEAVLTGGGSSGAQKTPKPTGFEGPLSSAHPRQAQVALKETSQILGGEAAMVLSESAAGAFR
ncbi:inactive sodium-dependent neutral amino acid transporter B(0)AT3 [Tamandua tetradactyla]|uniref:inactive sodium-dependent neutral amino acid transporter B(0)AT3 n=1 Tax=Tamandua tetradactyla TaxID=48850 RepID=UPI004054133C